MKQLLILIIGLLIFGMAKSQDSTSMRYWSGGTAYTTPKHRWELGVLTSSRYGVSQKIELSAHPLTFLVLPRMAMKVSWVTRSGLTVSTEHGLFYPTMAMRLVATKGTGGMISPEFTIPQMVAMINKVLISCQPFKKAVLTLNGGIALSVKSGPLDPRTTIDLPLIYPRLTVFYNQPVFDAGIDFRGMVTKRFGWLINVENIMPVGTDYNYFMENKTVIVYASKKGTCRIEAGYKLCFGKYPAAPQWHLLPAMDIAFGIGQ